MAAPKKISIVLAFAALYLIWGSTYLGILFAIQSIPPFLMAGSRFFLAGLIMFGIARTHGSLRSTWAEWREALIHGGGLVVGGKVGGWVFGRENPPSLVRGRVASTALLSV